MPVFESFAAILFTVITVGGVTVGLNQSRKPKTPPKRQYEVWLYESKPGDAGIGKIFPGPTYSLTEEESEDMQAEWFNLCINKTFQANMLQVGIDTMKFEDCTDEKDRIVVSEIRWYK